MSAFINFHRGPFSFWKRKNRHWKHSGIWTWKEFSSMRIQHHPQYSCISYASNVPSTAYSWDKRANPSYSNVAQVFQIHRDICSSFTSLKDRLRLVHLKIDLISRHYSIGEKTFLSVVCSQCVICLIILLWLPPSTHPVTSILHNAQMCASNLSREEILYEWEINSLTFVASDPHLPEASLLPYR